MKKLIYYSVCVFLIFGFSNIRAQTLFNRITLNANQAILLDNYTTIFNGFNAGQFYSATVSGNPGPGMPMKGAMTMLIDYNKANYDFIPINSTKYFTPGTGTYKFAPFLVDWSDLNDNTGNININLSDGRNLTMPCNQAILLDNFNQFPILGGFASSKTYVARVSDNTGAGMPMKGVFVMYIDNNEAKYEFVPSGGSLAFTPGSGSYKFCAFQVDWSDVNDNTGQTSVKIYSLDGVVVGVEEERISNKIFNLQQNYPNPFNPTTNINFTVPIKNLVTISLFNSIGQFIGTLINEEKEAGNYEIDFNAEGLTSGVYFYQLLAGEYKETKKMILLR